MGFDLVDDWGDFGVGEELGQAGDREVRDADVECFAGAHAGFHGFVGGDVVFGEFFVENGLVGLAGGL